MTTRLILIPLSLGALSACAGSTPPPRYVLPLPSNSPLMVRAMGEAARQVRRCYRAPRVASAGQRIVTQLRIRVTPDGAISGLPAVVAQSGVRPDNQAYADRMAQAAIESVMRCAPLVLPSEAYRGMAIVMELTFSPTLAA